MDNKDLDVSCLFFDNIIEDKLSYGEKEYNYILDLIKDDTTGDKSKADIIQQYILFRVLESLKDPIFNLEIEISKLKEHLEDSQRIIDGMPPIPRYKPTPEDIIELQNKIHNECLKSVNFNKNIIVGTGKSILNLIEESGYKIEKIKE